MLLPMFLTEAKDYQLFFSSSRPAPIYQAIREVNNKSDGVLDHLLPSTQLRIAYRDSKCNSDFALTAATDLISYGFGGQGVEVIIGAGCSGASVTAAQVAGNNDVPIISPSSTSPTLSNGKAYPYYTGAALVYSTDEYGAAGATAFADAATSAGLKVFLTVRFVKDAVGMSAQQHALLESRVRVVVFYCQIIADNAEHCGADGPGGGQFRVRTAAGRD